MSVHVEVDKTLCHDRKWMSVHAEVEKTLCHDRKWMSVHVEVDKTLYHGRKWMSVHAEVNETLCHDIMFTYCKTPKSKSDVKKNCSSQVQVKSTYIWVKFPLGLITPNM